MPQINTAAIGRLRDRLLETGGPPSRLVSGADLAEAASTLDTDEEGRRLFEAAFEAMYVMIAADGSIGQEERDVFRGAVRELTANGMRTAQIEAMMVDCEQRLKTEGATKRLETISGVLKTERVAAEAAFVLAAAMAFADSEIADEENDTLNAFADLLGIDGDRANALLDELEAP